MAAHLKYSPIISLPTRGKPKFNQEGFTIETPQFRVQIFKLPEEKFAAQALLYQQLQAAKKTIDVAMFTFTHAKIAKILEEKALQDVEVKVILDNKQRWLSEKLVPGLLASGAQVATHKTNQLFHHKWTWIDQKTWIVGSANWTKNGFTKNSELIAFLRCMTPNSQVRSILCGRNATISKETFFHFLTIQP